MVGRDLCRRSSVDSVFSEMVFDLFTSRTGGLQIFLRVALYFRLSMLAALQFVARGGDKFSGGLRGCGIEGCRGVVSGTTLGERSKEGETVSRSYDRQDSPHHEPGLQARAAMQLPASSAGGQPDELGQPADHERLPGDSNDAQASVRGSSEYSGAETHAHVERRGDCSASIGTVGPDVEGSRLRWVSNLRETSLRVGKVQGAEVKGVQGSSPHASAFGWLPPRMARENEVRQGKRLCVSQCQAERQEAAVRVHHGAEILAPCSHHRGRDLRGLEGTLRLSQLSSFAGDGTSETEGGPENRTRSAAPRGLRHDHGALCAVRHGLYAGCAREVPGTAHGRQNSPAHRASSVRIMGWIVGWKFPLFATKFFEMMVAREGVEPPTPAFSGLRSTT